MTYSDTNSGTDQEKVGVLVTTPISQAEQTKDEIHFFPESIRVKRYESGKNPEPPTRTGTEITGFSSKSKSRLRFVAINSPQKFISQLALTYHNEWSSDGRECKKQLNTFLTALRKMFPEVSYLWIMEFQTRKAPHFHIFLDKLPNEVDRINIARAWCRIIAPNDEQAFQWHSNRKNWIKWNMGSAGYLAKYLDKESQKQIPDGYHSFGRFWGNSRNSKPTPLVMEIDDLEMMTVVDKKTGEMYGTPQQIFRWLGRLAEKQTNGYSKFRKRVAAGSYTMLQGARAFIQIETYLSDLGALA